jgi:hypothetical protein
MDDAHEPGDSEHEEDVQYIFNAVNNDAPL